MKCLRKNTSVMMQNAIQNDKTFTNENEQSNNPRQRADKKEVFITWEQPQVLSTYFIQIDKAWKQLAKWKVKVSDDDMVIYVFDSLYESDWFSEETMTKWEEINDNDKNF